MNTMFFRRERPKKPTFEEHMNAARAAGFTVSPAGSAKSRVERNGLACVMQPGPDDVPHIAEATGVVIGKEIGVLTDGGFQKFFVTPGGKRRPALAEDLQAIHNFEADLREALKLENFYNESLGTVSTQYLYDRVADRDSGHADKPWEIRL